MKKVLKITAAIIFFTACAGVLLLFFSLRYEEAGNITFSCLFGSRYTKATEVRLKIGNTVKKLPVYKGKNKPFLLIGPVELPESGNDFIFVNRKQVVRSSNDKCENAWVRFFHWLFIPYDFTSTDCVRTNAWDDIESDPDGSIRFNGRTQEYEYSFRIDSCTIPVSFALPASLFIYHGNTPLF